MNPLEQQILSSFKQDVAARLPLHQMILFGSRARGDAEPDSDMDVLVILEGPIDASTEKIVSESAWHAGFEHGIVVVPITVSRQAWEEGPERHSLLAIAVRNDGITV